MTVKIRRGVYDPNDFYVVDEPGVWGFAQILARRRSRRSAQSVKHKRVRIPPTAKREVLNTRMYDNGCTLTTLRIPNNNMELEYVVTQFRLDSNGMPEAVVLLRTANRARAVAAIESIGE